MTTTKLFGPLDDGYWLVSGHEVIRAGERFFIETFETPGGDASCRFLAVPHLGIPGPWRIALCGQGASEQEAIDRVKEKLVGIPHPEIQALAA